MRRSSSSARRLYERRYALADSKPRFSAVPRTCRGQPMPSKVEAMRAKPFIWVMRTAVGMIVEALAGGGTVENLLGDFL